MSVRAIAMLCIGTGGLTAAAIPAEIWLRIWQVDPAPLADASLSVFIWLHAIQAVFGLLTGTFAAVVWVASLARE